MRSLTKPKILTGLVLLSCSCILFSIWKGSMVFTISQLLMTLFGHTTTIFHDIIFLIRIPRTFSAFVTGGLLSLSGCLMQILLRNPLADPYTLGISGGAAVMTILMSLCGFSGLWLTGGAFIGCLATIAIVLMLSKTKSPLHSERLLLIGIALSSGLAALISLLLLLSPEKMLHGTLFWLIGDLSYAQFPWAELIILIFSLFVTLFLARPLNILSLGKCKAQTLGLDIKPLQIKIYLLSGLLTATAVTAAGCIGFVGLIIPHLLRLMGVTDHRFLLPCSVLLGGSLLTLADTFSRTLFFPLQVPVGMMTALIGIPIFIFLLRKNL